MANDNTEINPLNKESGQAHEKMQRLLFDSNTKLPTLSCVLDEIKSIYNKNYSVAVVFININSVVNLEQIYGWHQYDALLESVSAHLESMKGKLLRKNDLITVMFPRSDHFLIFLSAPRNNARLDAANVEAISSRIVESLSAGTAKYSKIPEEYIKFNSGFSLISDSHMICPERALFKAVHEAEMTSMNVELKERQKIKEDLRKIISHQEIRTVFQPIVNISNFEIVGYEALTRGPQTTKYEAPMVLFSLADNYGVSTELEWVCIVKAIVNFNLNLNFLKKGPQEGVSENEPLLFLNTDPKTFLDEKVVVAKFKELVNKYYINPRNIVIEITERSAIEDFSKFKDTISELKLMGFNFAIDDAGAGYSSLQSIAELRPKFLKFDMVLVRGIDHDFIKQELLKTLLDFANKTGSIVVAEGIETEGEYKTVKALGAHLGQGYYFAKPSPQFIETLQFF